MYVVIIVHFTVFIEIATVVIQCAFKHALFVNTVKVRPGRNPALLLDVLVIIINTAFVHRAAVDVYE